MGRYAMQLNEKIRAVLIAAQLEYGLSAAETARAAEAGELEDLPPTQVSETTCRDLAAEARRGRSTQSNGTATSESDEARELGDAMAAEADERTYLEKQIARIKAIEEPTAKDLHALCTAMNALSDIDRREAKRAPRRPVKKKQTACRHFPRADGREPCSCAEPCVSARVAAETQEEIEKTAEALATGGTCQCQQPRPRGWCLDGDGNPTCESCRLTVENWEARFPGVIKGVERSRLMAAGKTFEEALALTEASPAR
jgi:hypothetical protein